MTPGPSSIRILAALMLVLSGCTGALEDIRERYRPESPRAAYLQGLEDTGIANRNVGRLWVEYGESALDVPVAPTLPYREVTALDPMRPEAHGYRLDLTRGRRLVVDITLDASEGTLVFADLFQSLEDRGLDRMRRIASADSSMHLSADIDRSGTYMLRIQPELLAQGRYEIHIRTEASIIFPVSGRDEYDIGSVFGDPRDGGRRSHHGLDIFAPRRTPVVAAVDGVIRSTRTGGLGGKTVWLRDSRSGNNYYYAHLDEQLVSRGQRVAVGDTLGLVGNTGNARSTPPHLHFGIYRNGPTDPYPFLRRSGERAGPVRSDTTELGQWMRVAAAGTRLVPVEDGRPSDDVVLPEYTSVRVVGAERNRYRVVLPDGRHGYVAAVQLESSDEPIDEHVLTDGADVLTDPRVGAPSLLDLPPGDRLPVLGRFENFLRVSLASGQSGWLRGS